jgi:serine phosphatase RsbU (regulator of sigma subunit)
MEVWGGNTSVDSGVIMAGLDVWLYSRPYQDSSAGGDVHYVSTCATGRINRLLLADVSGHGAGVAELAAQLRGLMRSYINFIDQIEFVRSMNRRFVALSGAAQFATALVMTFFAPNNHLSLCNAGHPPPLLYRADRGRWSLLEHDLPQQRGGNDNFPLGIEDLGGYAQFEIRLRVGDLVLCYTDSLIEASDAAGVLLGPRGLLSIVQKLDLTDPGRLIPELLARVQALDAANLAGDDLTLLVFRPNGLVARPALWNYVTGTIRAVQAMVAAIAAGERLPLPDGRLANIGGALLWPLGHMWRGGKALVAGRKPTEVE